MISKNLLKVVAAIAIVCLPFIAASCSKDDETGPVTHEYSWEITGVNLNDRTQSAIWLSAMDKVDELWIKAVKAAGFSYDATKTTIFSIEIDRSADIEDYDRKVKRAYFNLSETPTFRTEAEKLPESAKLIVKRGKTTILEEKLN